METWELEFDWLRIRHYVKDSIRGEVLPDLNAILFLIGIQELGQLRSEFSKEEKQDLLHIAVCRLMSMDGIYSFEGIDEEGWPHWNQVKTISKKGEAEQEQYLKSLVIRYFDALNKEGNE